MCVINRAWSDFRPTDNQFPISPRPGAVYGDASFAGEFLCLFAAIEMSLVSQSPVNPPAAIFRRHGGLPEGGSSWRPTVGGG